MRNCKKCKNAVEEERVSILNSWVCSSCAHKGAAQSPIKKGIMVWSHKTAPSIQIVTQENFADYERYTPKFGHGSGVHAVSSKLVK